MRLLIFLILFTQFFYTKPILVNLYVINNPRDGVHLIKPNELMINNQAKLNKNLKNDLLYLKSILANDVVYCEKNLKSTGFFEGISRYSCVELHDKFVINFIIDYGKIFKIDQIFVREHKKRLDIDTGSLVHKRVDFEKIIDFEKRMIKDHINSGYPFFHVRHKKVKVFHEKGLVNLYFDVECGGKGTFGKTVILGNKFIKKEFILKQITWSEGEVFNLEKIELFKKKLAELGLFEKISVKWEMSQIGGKKVIIKIHVDEVKTRLFELGMKYSTSSNVFYNKKMISKMRGVFGICSFSNFNLFGNGELLNLLFEGMPFYNKHALSKKLDIDKVSPDFMFRSRLQRPRYDGVKDMFYTLVYYNTWNIKYVKRSNEFEFRISNFEDPFSSKTIGAEFESYNLRDFSTEDGRNLTKRKKYSFFNMFYKHTAYSCFDFCHRNNQIVYECYISPKFGKESVLNIKTKVSAMLNFEIIKVVFWGSYDFVFVKNINVLPSDKLLYSGGPNSVRGYAKNYASKFIGDYPEGGRGCIEAGIECIKKINKKWDGALFFDASKLGRQLFPGNAELFSSIGCGLRYHTSIGLVKADLAFPMKKRKIDSRFQILISIGSSFN